MLMINVNDKSNLNYVNVCNNLVVEGDTILNQELPF